LDGWGFPCFLAHEDLEISEEWKARILLELQIAGVFAAVLSRHFKQSDWCEQELGLAVGRSDVLIVPLSIDGTMPYGFIDHLHGQRVSDPGEIEGIIRSVLFRKRPHLVIPRQIEKVRRAGSYRGAEAAVRPLVPVFGEFTPDEITAFVDAATGNSEVWDAGRCQCEYLPQFMKVNASRLTEADKAKLDDVLYVE
jgi:hypothetical protein